MITVNGKGMKVHDFDTLKTIKNRIAVSMKVLPLYVYINVDNKEEEFKDIIALNIIDEIKNLPVDSLKGFFDENKSKYSLSKDTFPVLYYQYVIKEKEMGSADNLDPYTVEQFVKTVEKDFHTKFEFIKTKAKDFSSDYSQQLKQFLKDEESYKKTISNIKDLPSVFSTATEITRTKIEVSFTVAYDIYELFNHLTMSREIPFAFINNFYKVLNNFVPSKYWIFTEPDIHTSDRLVLKVLNIQNEICSSCEVVNKETRTDLYSNVVIFFEPLSISLEEQKNKVHLFLESDINPTLSQETLIKRIVNAFPQSELIQDISPPKQIQIKTEFYVPKFVLDRSIFSDLAMNDPFFSSFLIADEHNKLQKQKGGIHARFMVSPNIPDTDHVTFSVSEYVVEPTSFRLMKLDKRFKVGESYLKIRVTKSSHKKEADMFRNIFTRLLSYYETKKQDVISVYQKYIPDFEKLLEQARKKREEKVKKVHRTRVTLNDIHPELFPHGYARLCQKKPPVIVAEKNEKSDAVPPEVARLQDRAMLFPKVPEEGKQYWYSCASPKNGKYTQPYLKQNTMENREKYPVVPCCCIKEQTSKRKSFWKMYYEDDMSMDEIREYLYKEEGGKKDKYVYTTNKILPAFRIGHLPKDIQSFFQAIDRTHNYLRCGSFQSVNSAIEVVWNAVDPDARDIENQQVKLKKLREIRDKLLQFYTAQTTQEGYQDSMASYRNDPEKFFDPQLFVKALEDYFKVHIFIFTRNEEYPDGILAAPHFTEEYLKLKESQEQEKRPYVLLYTHSGTEFDSATYPQCEVIFSTQVEQAGKKKGEVERVNIFPSTTPMIPRIKDIFRMMYQNLPSSSVPSSSVPSSSVPSDITVQFKNKITHQGIDCNGKTRFLTFSNLTILTSPLPSLNLPLSFNYIPVKYSVAQKFLESESISDYSSDIIDNKLVGIKAKKGEIGLYIPLIPSKASGDVKENSKTPESIHFLMKESQIQSYNEFNRMSRYMTEYLFYLFSIYYKTHPIEKIDGVYLKNFALACIDVDPNFEYGKVIRAFTREAGVLRKNKLVVHREEIKKRLMYSLLLELKHNEAVVKNYSSFRYLQRYFSEINDFQLNKLENALIVHGKDTLIRWLYNRPVDYTLQHSVVPPGKSLELLLQDYDKTKIFMILFTSSRNNFCKTFEKRIYTRKLDRKYPTLMERYFDKVHFVYINIEDNRGIATAYNVSSVPFVYFMKFDSGKDRLKELAHIQLSQNVYENLQLVNNKIQELV